MALPIDLTTVSACKLWLSPTGTSTTNTVDDPQIQACITAFSADFLRRTGRGPQDGSFPEQSPFVSICPYTEVYDGNGWYRMFTRNNPIQTVTSIIMGTQTLAPSLTFGQPGYVVDGTHRSISLRGGRFCRGVQNIQISYTAGFDGVPVDIEMIARKTVALYYKRRDWIGLRSKSMANGAGTVSYTDFENDPDVTRAIIEYTRWTL